MSPQNSNGFQSMKQHKYYIDSADLTVIAEDTRFKIHSHFLTRESPVFREQIGRLEVLPLVAIGDHAAPPAVNPIVLDASVKADHFGKLLSVFYPDKYIYDKPAEDWDIILALAIKWSFGEVRDLCIRELSKANVPIALRLAIFEANNLDGDIVHPLYSTLCTSEQPLTLADMERLGIRSSYIIMTARERLRSPGVKGHSPLPVERLAQVQPTLSAIFDSISLVNTTSRSTGPNGTESNNQSTSGQSSNSNKGRAGETTEGNKNTGDKGNTGGSKQRGSGNAGGGK